MGRIVAIALLSTLFLGATAFAADAVVGTWKLNVAKSKFSGTAPKSATRVYAESADGTTLDQKIVSADGKEISMHVTIKDDGKDYPVTGNPDGDSVARKVIDAFAKAERSGSASITVDGVFVDYPIVYKAERIVALAESIAGRQPMAKAP